MKNERIWSGKVALHHFESKVTHLSIIGNFSEVTTDKRKRFALITLFDLKYFFNRFPIKDVATDPVSCIGRIDDNTTLLQTINDLFNQTGLRITGID
jgi:hypothetical protein